jgi:hypothetical protein
MAWNLTDPQVLLPVLAVFGGGLGIFARAMRGTRYGRVPAGRFTALPLPLVFVLGLMILSAGVFGVYAYRKHVAALTAAEGTPEAK